MDSVIVGGGPKFKLPLLLMGKLIRLGDVHVDFGWFSYGELKWFING